MSKPPPPIEKGPLPPPPVTPGKKPGAPLAMAVVSFLTFIYRVITFQWSTAKFESRLEKKSLLKELAQQLGVIEGHESISLLKKAPLSDISFFLSIAKIKRTKTFEFLVAVRQPKLLPALRLATQIDQLLGNRLSGSEKPTLLEFLLQHPDLSVSLKEIVQEAISLQKNKEKQPNAEQSKALVDNVQTLIRKLSDFFADNKIKELEHQFIHSIANEILYATAFPAELHSQEAVRACYMALSFQPRLQPSPINPDFSSLRIEMRADKNIFNLPPDQKIKFPLSVHFYYTDPLSKMTRHFEKVLPFAGEMTVSEAQLKLEALYSAAAARFPSEDIPPEYTAWRDSINPELYKLIADFNATETRPKGAFALEIPQMQKYLQNTSSPSAAIEAASLQNIFCLKDGRLALVPELGENPAIAACMTATPTVPAFFSEGTFETIETTHETVGTLKTAEKKDYVEITTTIRDNLGRSHTSTTIRQLDGKSKDQVMQEYQESGYQERDYLLAKAEFMRKHGFVTGNQWDEYCFSQETRLSSKELEGLREKLKGELGFHGKMVRRFIEIGKRTLSLGISGEVVEDKLNLKLQIHWMDKPMREYTISYNREGKSGEQVVEAKLEQFISECIGKFKP